MPDLLVTSGAAAGVTTADAAAAAPTPELPGLFILAVFGAVIVLAALAVFFRKKPGWALAMLILALVVSGAGLASAASVERNPVQAEPPGPADPAAAVPATELGAALFVAKGCVACHKNNHIDRKYYEFQPEFGPDLTSYKPAPDFLRNWLKDPAALRSTVLMPNLELKETEIEALIAFLCSAASQEK